MKYFDFQSKILLDHPVVMETGGREIMMRGEPSKNEKSAEESLAESWSFLERELEEFQKICHELDSG